MAIGTEMLTVQPQRPAMAMTEKELRAACPKATHLMALDSEYGIHIVPATGLAPIYMLQSIPERGFNAGEVHGMFPHIAKQVVAKGYGMELVDVAKNLKKGQVDVKPSAAPPTTDPGLMKASA